MNKDRYFIFEKLIFAAVLGGSLLGFWYFETSLFIKMIALVLVIIGLILAIKPNPRYELQGLLAVYLGIFSLYNLIYLINFPIYMVMIFILALVMATAFLSLTMDGSDKLIDRPIFWSLIFLLGLIIVEVFLSLYFWPIGVEIKTLVLVVVYYQTTSVIYLYVRSMLRLNRIIGYLIVNLLVLAAVFWTLWPRIPK